MGKPGKGLNSRGKKSQENPFRVKTVNRKKKNAKKVCKFTQQSPRVTSLSLSQKSKDMQLAMDEVDDMFFKIQQTSVCMCVCVHTM